MGCDIHVMVEARNFPGRREKGDWINVDDWRYNPWYPDDDEPMLSLRSIYRDRNYELFAFLAGVRNYGDNPSFEFDRGIPKDVAGPTRTEYDSWGSDAHTPGYATLAELKEKISAVSKIQRKGMVHKDQVKRYNETGETPESWAQWVGGAFADRYEWLEWEDEVRCFDAILSAIEERKRDVFWIFDAEKDDGRFDQDIRIVFWFDN